MKRRTKRTSAKQQVRAQTRLGLGLLGIIVCLVGFSYFFQAARKSVWDGRSMINLVIQEEEGEIRLESFRLDKQRWTKLIIPENTQIEVPFGYGQYQLKNVYSLGKLDERGGELLRRTTQDMLALPVQGWLVKQTGTRQTNLSWWDKWRLWIAKTWQVRKQVEIRLVETGAWVEARLKDNSLVYRVESRLLDELINQEFFNQQIAEEGLTVAVVNSSGAEGLARTVTRLVTNLGSQVVWVGNDEQVLEASKILVGTKDLIKSVTVEALVDGLGIVTVEPGEVSGYRADVVIMLGLDYAQVE